MNKLILESVWSRACTLVEILEAAYRDPQGHRYWELWLFEPLPIYQFAELLALDSAATNGVSVLDRYLFQIFERLRAAAEAGETWLMGDTSPLITETWSSLSLRNSAVTVRPREAIAWMHRNPNARHLVPTVLAGMAESLAERTNALGADGEVSSDTMSQVRTSTSRTSSVARASIVGKRPRRGPTPGEIDRHAVSDRALFPEVNRLVDESHKSVHAAALELALAGRIEGVGTPESRAKRLAKRFRKERP